MSCEATKRRPAINPLSPSQDGRPSPVPSGLKASAYQRACRRRQRWDSNEDGHASGGAGASPPRHHHRPSRRQQEHRRNCQAGLLSTRFLPLPPQFLLSPRFARAPLRAQTVHQPPGGGVAPVLGHRGDIVLGHIVALFGEGFLDLLRVPAETSYSNDRHAHRQGDQPGDQRGTATTDQDHAVALGQRPVERDLPIATWISANIEKPRMLAHFTKDALTQRCAHLNRGDHSLTRIHVPADNVRFHEPTVSRVDGQVPFGLGQLPPYYLACLPACLPALPLAAASQEGRTSAFHLRSYDSDPRTRHGFSLGLIEAVSRGAVRTSREAKRGAGLARDAARAAADAIAVITQTSCRKVAGDGSGSAITAAVHHSPFGPLLPGGSLPGCCRGRRLRGRRTRRGSAGRCRWRW